MQVTWLHPWLLLGTLASALPIVIHLIGRRRAPTVSFAAFDFLMAVNKRLARRERLRQFLLLLLRTLAILALVFAAGRPMPFVALSAVEVQKRVVVVLDASESMGYLVDDEPLLERAKSQLLELVSHLAPGDGLSLVVAGEEMEVPFQALTVDHGAFRRELGKITQTSGTADLGAAIEKGLAHLGDDGSGATVVVLSDFSVNSFENMRPITLEPPPELRLLDVSGRQGKESLDNIAIESMEITASPLSSLDRLFKIRVRNFGPRARQRQGIELLIEGKVKQRGYVDLGAGKTTLKPMTVSFDEPGVYHGMIRLVADERDGFARDDRRFFVVEVARGVRVLAVNGDPRMTPYEDELFFVERALEVVPEGESLIALDIITQEEMQSEEVLERLGKSVDVLLLANIREFPPRVVEELVDFVKGGGGVLVALGDRILFERTNEQLVDILPHPIRDFHQAYDPISESPPLGVGEFDWDHPVLRGLGLSFEESLRMSRTKGYFNLATGAQGKTRALLRFDNGAPALVERVGEGGRVMLMTSTLDLDHSDLVLRTGFPALLQRVCRYLAQGALEVSGNIVRVGQELELPVPTGVSAVAFVNPSGERSVEETAPGVNHLRVDDWDEMGIYRVEVLRKAWEPMTQLDVAVNPTLVESDFHPIEFDEVIRRLSGGDPKAVISLNVGGASDEDPFAARGFASYFLLALSLFFVSECLLASRG